MQWKKCLSFVSCRSILHFFLQGSMGRNCFLFFMYTTNYHSCMIILGYAIAHVYVLFCMNKFLYIVICEFLSKRKCSNVFFSLAHDLFQVVVTYSTFLSQGWDDLVEIGMNFTLTQFLKNYFTFFVQSLYLLIRSWTNLTNTFFLNCDNLLYVFCLSTL
jgi:hypothetical protein